MSYDKTIDGYLKTINLIRSRALAVRYALKDIAGGDEPKAAAIAEAALGADRIAAEKNPLVDG